MRCQHEHVSVNSVNRSIIAGRAVNPLLLRASSAIPDEILNRLSVHQHGERLLHAANIHARSVDGDDQKTYGLRVLEENRKQLL